MSHFKLVHEQNCNPEKFWEVFFDDAYNKAIYKHVGTKERQFLDLQDHGDTKTWVLRVFPERDLPDFVKKLVKGDLGYIEHAVMHKSKNRIESRIEPTLFKDKTRINSVYTVESIGPNKVRRTMEGDVDVSFPLIGKKVESVIVADLEKAYQAIADFTNEWLANHA
jgi:hypothetical protein